jgi:hypothetical protein
MILSSADILRVLGGDAIVRQEARVEIVKDRPGLGTDDIVYVYVEKYPVIEEFEAVWRIWILDNSGMGQYVLNALTSLLPSFEFNGDHYTVREFASERTVVKSQAEKDHEELQKERVELRTELSGLQAGVEDRLKAVRDGVDGKDGKDGRDGADGRDGRDGKDGKDLEATQVDLEDLANVEQGIPKEKGQVLTWDGAEWTNLFVPQFSSVSGGGRGTGGGVATAIVSDDAPTERDDGSELQEGDIWWESDTGAIYVYYNSAWVQSSGEGGSGVNTLAALLDTDVTGVEDGEILIYRSATGDWTAEPAPVGGVSSVSGKTGDVTLVKADITDFSDADYATAAQGATADTALQAGDNISELTNDAGYITAAEVPADAVSSVNGQTGVVSLGIDDLVDVTVDPGLLEKDYSLVYDGTEWVVASPPVLVDGHNQTGATILKATPVYVAGTHNSGKPLLGLADANGSGNAPAIGLTHEDITDGIDGHVMLSGVLTNVDTSAYLAGEALYLSTTPGVLTNVRPTAANEKVQKVGLVTRSHASAGSILITGAGRTNDINNELVALIGAGDRNAVDLGAFTGSTISDNVDIKVALQELETAVESTVDSIADLADTDVTGVQDGEILVYRSATGDWTAEPAPATGLQPGDNVSELTNDANYITLADVPDAPVDSVNGQTGIVILTADDVGALESGDNISELTNDAGYITDAGVTQIVAGTNITINPADGTGAVTINAPPSGVPEAPLDGNYYVRASGAWVKLTDALSTLGVIFTDPVDAGNFTTGLGTAITNAFYDGGNFTDGTSTATDNDIIDGGLTTP